MAGRRWTQEELKLLEELSGVYPVKTIAKKLGSSFDAVNLKLDRLGIMGFAKNTDLLTLNQVSIMLGVEHRTLLNKWKRKGLRFRRKGYFHTISQQKLIEYLKNHPEDWNATKVTDDSLIMGFDWYKKKKKTDEKASYYWTPAEVSKLNYLRHEGYTIREIAEKMGRSESSIKYRLYIYGGKKHGSSIR